MTPSIAIILVEPENPDNIGAVARAMKNMGLSDLRCVNPPKQWRVKGKKLAMSACDVLKNAKVFKSTRQAITDSHWVIGTTRRKGPRRGVFLDFDRAIEDIKMKSAKGQVAILFGKESKGLDNASLELCDSSVMIPSHESYPSLNLAQAVMVISFSLFSRAQKNKKQNVAVTSFCSQQETQEMLTHFERALRVLDYDVQRGNLRGRILSVFHGIFKRSGLLEIEAQMIKGLSARITQKLISCKS